MIPPKKADASEFGAAGSAGITCPPIMMLLADQRRRWREGESPLVEEYLKQYPALASDSEVVLDLLYNEVVAREECGETPQPDEYTRRFPDLADSLRDLMDLHSAVPAISQTSSDGTRTASEFSTNAAHWPSIPGYTILGVLGRGATSVVYKAKHLQLQRVVALKMILAGGSARPDQLERFNREAKVVARLRHPAIIQIYEVGEHAGQPYLSLEYVAGGSLQQRLGGKPQAALEAAQLVESLAHAIQVAHLENIIHRDLKPANILLSDERMPGDDGRAEHTHSSPFKLPKITDFGLAKLREERSGQTASGDVLGTPSYMAPEQATGNNNDVGPAADIYALGAILYELLTGRPPFHGATVLDTLQQVLKQEVVPPRRLQPKVPRDLDTICLKCLEKAPAGRYSSATALADDLRRFLNGAPVLARPVGLGGKVWRWTKRNRAVAALLASVFLLLLVIAVGGVVWSLQLQDDLNKKVKDLGQSKQNLDRAQQQIVVEKLLAQAQSSLNSRRPGQRFESLRLLREAIDLARQLELPPERFAEMRDTAIAILALPDLHLTTLWEGFPPGSYGVDFSEDLTLYARTDQQGNCSIRRVDGHAEVCAPVPGSDLEVFPRLSHDGRFVAVYAGNGRGAKVWNVEGASPVLIASTSNVNWVEFHHDGKRVAMAHGDGTISLHDLTGATKSQRLSAGHISRGIKIALHPSRDFIAVCSYFSNSVQVREMKTGRVVADLTRSIGAGGCAWSPAGRTLGVSADNGGMIALYDFEPEVPAPMALRLQQTLVGRSTGEAAIRFNRAGDRLAAVGWDEVVHLFNLDTGRLLFQTPLIRTPTLRFSPGDRQLAGARPHLSNQLGIWSVGDEREYCTLANRGPGGKPLEWWLHSTASVHPNGRLLAAGTRDGLAFWDLETGRLLGRWQEVSAEAGAVQFETSGSLLVNGPKGLFRWPIQAPAARGEPFRIGPPERLSEGGKERIAASRDGKFIALAQRRAGANQQLAGGWIIHSDQSKARIRLDPGADVSYIAISSDDHWVATGIHCGDVKVWNANTGRLEQTLPHAGSANCRFSPDGLWLCTENDRNRLYHVGTFEPGPQLGEGAIADFSPDGKQAVLTTISGHLRLVETATGREIARFEDPHREVNHFAMFTHDGARIVAVSNGTVPGIHVWDLHRIRGQLADLGLGHGLPSYSQPTTSIDQPLQMQWVIDLPEIKPLTEPGMLEAENLWPVEAEDCWTLVQHMGRYEGRWSNGQQLFCRDCKPGSFIDLELKAPRAGRYQLQVHFTKSTDFGVIQVQLDGKQLGQPFDGFHENVAPSGRIEFPVVALEAGKHVVRFAVAGKNVRSTNYFFGIDCLQLTPAQ